MFPLSNWTELDIWQYIHLESIPIVPLYLSAVRPVVERDGLLIMVDDDRLPLKPGEQPMLKNLSGQSQHAQPSLKTFSKCSFAPANCAFSNAFA